MQYALIHIGKCGGSSLRDALANQEIYGTIRPIHVKKPTVDKNTKYFIVARDPIDRCISAFNWRKHLVLETKAQENRFAGEKDVLQEYLNFNSLCESLYTSDGYLDKSVSLKFESVHHLKERISFYLFDFLRESEKEQLQGVLMQASLNEDISELFKINNKDSVRKKKNARRESEYFLSEKAKNNLVSYIKDDYLCLVYLFRCGLIKRDQIESILDKAGLSLNSEMLSSESLSILFSGTAK